MAGMTCKPVTEEDSNVSIIDFHSRLVWANCLIDMDDKKSSQETKKMPKVPQLLKENENYERYFKPMVVAIGPYHCNDERLHPTQELKPMIAKEFLGRRPVQSICESFDAKIRTSEVKDYYYYHDEKGNYTVCNEDEFVKMMFLDACFVLHFIDRCDNDKLPHRLTGGVLDKYKVFIQQDMLLLENQLPWKVLEVLMKIVFTSPEDSSKMMSAIHRFMNDNTGAVIPSTSFPATWETFPQSSDNAPLHLLSIFRNHLLQEAQLPCIQTDQDQKEFQQSLAERKKKWLGMCRAETHYHEFPTFRGVKELNEVGMQFRASKSSSLRDIQFKSELFVGSLSLPPMTIDDSTKRKYLNLVAYEMCPHGPWNPEVMSYIYFMDSLIDEADDVKWLRLAGILNNFLPNDADVADLFNTIAIDLVPNLDTYASIRDNIQGHINNKRKTWMAQFMNQHFSSPWTVAAFTGIVFTILVTVIQTWFTIFPLNSGEEKSGSKVPPSGPRRRYGMMG